MARNAPRGYLAFDLGAESGRAMLARFDGRRVALEEVHRFANPLLNLPTGLHWNVTGLWMELVAGLRLAGHKAAQQQLPLVSLGVDTWGVDYALLGQSGQVLTWPFSYRDARHEPAMRPAIAALGEKALYAATGIQFMPFNTLFQLLAQAEAEPAAVAAANRLLFMPDLLHYFFTGVAVNEATIASTSQMLDPRPERGRWAGGLLRKLDLPLGCLGRIVPAGTRLGPVRPEVLEEAGVAALDVIAPASHDTASAVAAVPVDTTRHPHWAYLSSGTWSLMGAELPRPIVTEAARIAGFTNERGVEGTVRFLKNISGLWLLQQVRRDYARRGHEFDYAQLAQQAAEAEPFRVLLHPDHPPFATPGDMGAKIAQYAHDTGQPALHTPGGFARACLESLALTYRLTLDRLEGLLGERIDVLHVVGGGGRNALLNQMTADALGRPVIVGPFEAAAVGNALTQALGDGRIKDLKHLRRVVRESFELTWYYPRDPGTYERQMARFRALPAVQPGAATTHATTGGTRLPGVGRRKRRR